MIPIEKSTIGRPSKYLPQLHIDQAFKLGALGLIDKEIASFFNIATSTFKLWKKKHPEFSAAVERGKICADAKVAVSLYQSAIGAVYVEHEKIVIYQGKITIVKLKKQLPPSFVAQKFWLNNRQPELWGFDCPRCRARKAAKENNFPI